MRSVLLSLRGGFDGAFGSRWGDVCRLAAATLCLAAAVVGGEPSAALPAAPTLNPTLRAVPAPGPVTPDGDLAEWDDSGAIAIADNQQQPRKLVRVAAMYDADALYLALQFKDPQPLVNHVDPVASPSRAWCGDCVQLRFNTGPYPDEAPPKPLQIVHVDAYFYSDGRRATALVVYGELSPGGRTYRTIAEAEGAGVVSGYHADPDGDGYVQELRLDRALLRPGDPTPFAAGQSIHLALEPMWGNPQYKDQPAERVTDLLNPKRPERDMIWANPQAFGTLVFADRNKLEPSATAALWPVLCERWKRTARPVDAGVAEAPAAPPDRPCLESRTEVERLLNAWYSEKTAAGNAGDWYDNRDREHASVARGDFPQLRSVTYTPQQKLDSQDYALFFGVRPEVTFGNSSTAAPPDRGGCNPRYALLHPVGLQRLYAQYRGNNLYVYPAHHDYHSGRNGHGFYGDILPLNCPYYILSRGSSGSDIPFLNAFIHATAAFNPEVKRLLVRQGLLMPTLQALLRSSYKAVASPEDYFTGKAHPAVFEGSLLDDLAMAQAAHAMSADSVPPLAQFVVSEDEPLVAGINAPDGTGPECWSESPAAVGFVFRRWDNCLRLTADAGPSRDWAGKPLTYRWALLQGDPDKVRIETLDGGRRARCTIGWHPRFAVQPGSPILGNRVDIGLFVSNGKAWSAPAIVSVICPDNEYRTYDARGRLIDVQYAARDTEIGFPTTALLPAEGVAPYDIRDWGALLNRAASGTDLFGRLCTKALTPAEREVLAQVGAALTTQQENAAAAQSPDTNGLNARWHQARERSERLSQSLLESKPALGGSVKDRVERLLNAWQNDPEWYLTHQADLDAALAQAPPAARDAVVRARDRLVTLGIYRAEEKGWELQPHQPGAEAAQDRLPLAERAELREFHLALETQVLLPGVLVRDAQFNYFDARLRQAPPQWLAFTYDGDAPRPTSVTVRAVATPPPPLPLEDP